MTLTTIKVETAVRDVLKAQAAQRGRTLGEHLTALADAEARALRLARLGAEVRRTPADEGYLTEAEAWGSDAWT